MRDGQTPPTFDCRWNQISHHPNKWDKTGTVKEVHQFDQYVIDSTVPDV